jgi:serpin B
VTEDQLQDSTSAVLNALEMESDGLSIANGLWSGKHLAHDFTEQCSQLYQAEVTILDLSNAVAAASRINGWVSQKTDGKIRSIVEPGSLGGASVVLTNALYFHGIWSKPFPKNITREANFHLADGGEKKVQMMHQPELSGAYHRGEGFEAVSLDYQASYIRFYAILPRAGTSPEQVLARVSLQALEPALERPVDLYLPRFTMDFSHKLNDLLIGMGMAAAFAPSDDFRPMGAGKLFLSLVQHRAALEVDEEGTTASGGTAVILSRGPPMDKTLVFDRPFAVLLRDTRTGAVLFAGVVYEPGP